MDRRAAKQQRLGLPRRGGQQVGGRLAQALRHLLENPEERTAMGQAAQKRALEKFSVAAMADQYEALYRGQDRAS